MWVEHENRKGTQNKQTNRNMMVFIASGLTTTLHLTLKMTTAQVVATSVTNNSPSKDYPHPDDHAKEITVY